MNMIKKHGVFALTLLTIIGIAAFSMPEAPSRVDPGEAVDLLVADNPRKERRDDRQEDRPDRREDRRDCRQDEGRVGNDKRECKQDERGEVEDGDAETNNA